MTTLIEIESLKLLVLVSDSYLSEMMMMLLGATGNCKSSPTQFTEGVILR